MSTSEPPREEQPGAGAPGQEPPPSEQPTISAHQPSGYSGEPGREAGEQPTVPAHVPSQEGSAPPGGHATTAVASPSGPPPPDAPDSRRRWWRRRPRRRWPWISGAVIVALVVLAAIFWVGLLVGSHHGRHGRFHRGDGGLGHGRLYGMPGPGGTGSGWAYGPGPGGNGRWGGFGLGGSGGGTFARPAGPAVLGTLASVNGANLVINQDGGQQVTVPTTAQTMVVGDQRTSVTDLRPGDRVAVREDATHNALGVLVIPARMAGTVTALTGDQATVSTPSGLTETVDVSGVTNKPKVGDRVMVTGTATNNGTAIKATQLRVLPVPAS